jgi:hypothetical protein
MPKQGNAQYAAKIDAGRTMISIRRRPQAKDVPYHLIDQFGHDKLGIYKTVDGGECPYVKPDYQPAFCQTAQE